MKQTIITLLLISSLASFRNEDPSSKAHISQQPEIFTGHWKYKSGNEVFIINLWKTADGYRGHYKKIIVDANNNEVSEIFNSDKPVIGSLNWPFALYSNDSSIPDHTIAGIVLDNTVANPINGGGFISGGWNMKIINPDCYITPTINCNLQAKFTVKRGEGLRIEGEPDFSIPTDVILTKE